MASPRASFRLKQSLIDEVLEVFPGDKSSHSYVEALEYAVRQKRLELSDNVVPPVRQVESKLSDSSKATVLEEVAKPHLSDNPVESVRQSEEVLSLLREREPPVRTTSVQEKKEETGEKEDISDLMRMLKSNDTVSLPKGLKDPRQVVHNDDPFDDSEVV